MSKFIEVMDKKGFPQLVNVDSIERVFPEPDKTLICFTTDLIHVRETYEEVRKMIRDEEMPKVTEKMVREARSICTNMRCEDCKYKAVEGCVSKFTSDYLNEKNGGGKEMKYRKKPVVVEAYQTDKEVVIHTLEGDMKANVGDYIITGVNGEQYPCKPDIFEKTYEPVEEEEENK